MDCNKDCKKCEFGKQCDKCRYKMFCDVYGEKLPKKRGRKSNFEKFAKKIGMID